MVDVSLIRIAVRAVLIQIALIGPNVLVVLVNVTLVVSNVAVVLTNIFPVAPHVSLILIDVALIRVAIFRILLQIFLVLPNVFLVLLDILLPGSGILALRHRNARSQTCKSNSQSDSPKHTRSAHVSSTIFALSPDLLPRLSLAFILRNFAYVRS